MPSNKAYIKPLTVCLLLLLSTIKSFAQDDKSLALNELELALEQVISSQEGGDIQQLLDELIPLLEKPIPINQASVDDFEQLAFLSPMQAQAIIEYRTDYGDIYSKAELSMIDGFNADLAELCALFFSFNELAEQEYPNRYRHNLLLRTTNIMEEQAGYAEGKFEGYSPRIYARYGMASKKINAGFTLEKDPGESYFAGSNSQGFDYMSAFAQFDISKTKSKIIIGDYLVQWGQGISLWQGFSIGKSADMLQVARLNEGIKAYTSTDENNFMRGLAFQQEIKNFSIMAFASYKAYDANIDSVNGTAVFTSLQSSGLHRTKAEIADKDAVNGFITGTKLNYRHKKLKLGLAGNYTYFNLPMHPRDQAYTQYLFHGQQQFNASLNYQYNFKRLFLFGETAINNGAWASLNGLLYQPIGQVGISLLQRNISLKYHALFASALTENSKVNDEQGTYIGLKLLPFKGLSINAYADFFHSKWIKYTTSSPSKGQEFTVQASYLLKPNISINARYFAETKGVKLTNDGITKDVNQSIQKLRLQIDASELSLFSLRTRFDMSNYKHEQHSFGWMVAQDFGYTSRNEQFKQWLRLAYFDTDDYDSRVYAYENDLLYQFSVPAFYDNGVRVYVNSSIKINRNFQLWFKLARTWYLNKAQISSGTSAIAGNKRTELKLQARIKI